MPGGVEVSLVEGKVTVHIYVALGKNTRVDISSGNITPENNLRALSVFRLSLVSASTGILFLFLLE